MRIQIIGIPRGGTSYIYDVVRRYHNPLQLVEFGNEPFHPTLYVNDDTDVTNFYKKHINDIRNTNDCVVKNHVQHLLDLQQKGLLNSFRNNIDYNLVMIRRNIFDITLSSIVSTTQHEWFRYKKRVKKMEVELELFEHWWRGIYYDTLKIYENQFEFDYNEVVYYENFTRTLREDWSNTKLCNTYYKVLADLKAVYTKAPAKEKVVKNYQELIEFADKLRKTDRYKTLNIDEDFSIMKLEHFNENTNSN
jgi:hypothetical protein